MRRNLRRAGIGLIILVFTALLALDLYTDMHPEVLLDFRNKHPELFPDMPWWGYVLATVSLYGLLAVGWWRMGNATQNRFRKDN